MSNKGCKIDSKRSSKTSVEDVKLFQQDNQNELEKMKISLNSIKNQIRLVKLRQNEADSKLGFSLRGGKEATGSSVGVFVSHVERCSEADRKGLKIGDQLLQVNGLNVNQATYEEVIGLIKQTPKFHDILLKVNNLGKIPFQEKSGDCIKWLQVMDLIDNFKTSNKEILDKAMLECSITNENKRSATDETTNEHEIKPTYSSPNNINAYSMCKQATSSLSSDEGIESCESRRAISLSSESENELPPLPPQNQENSAPSSTLTLSNDETCSCSSACNISISSVQTTTSTNTTTSGELENEQATRHEQQQYSSSSSPEDIEIIVQVPGGKRTNESFGCGVVKGPDEWPGIFVQNVKPGSLAQRVGLRPGDQLTRADGQALVELTFDAAIGLIKQLQQQQDELLLHVKKGAALKHLSENRQRNQVNQRQQLVATETQQSTGGEVVEAEAIKRQQKPLNITCGKRETTSKTTSNNLDETSWSFGMSSSSSSSSSSTSSSSSSSSPPSSSSSSSSSNQMQAPSNESANRKAFTTSNNGISGTQNQLSGKHWPGALKQQQQQQVSACSQDEGGRFDPSPSQRRRGAASIKSEEETDLVEEDTKQTTIRINGSKLSSHANANPANGKYKFDVGNSMESRSSSNQRQSNSKFLIGEEQQANLTYEIKTKHQQQHVASSFESPNFCDLNENHSDNNNNNDEDKSVRRGYSFEDDSRKLNCHYQIKNIDHNKTRLECEDNSFINDHNNVRCDDTEDGDNDNEEEIKIVSQNCKLHNHAFHNNYSKSNLAQEKFAHHQESRQLQQVSKSRDILTRKIKLNEAATSKKRQTVDDMRRQLDVKGSSRGPTMHRYVSFENLNSSRLACSIQKQHQQLPQQQHLPRGSSATRRANAEENRYIDDDYIIYSRPQVEQQRSLSKQRLYSRSSSVLSQNAFQGTCCTQARPSRVELASQVGGKAVRCVQKQQQQNRQLNGIFPMVRQHSQCCLQQHHYGSALDQSFALSRSKARSMDKLNMSINLNYVNIGQNAYKVSRQALLGKACGIGSMTSSGGTGNSGSGKQQRRMLLKNQLASHNSTTLVGGGGLENDSFVCYKPNALRPFTCQSNSIPVSFYNYSTASRLISTVSGGSSATAMQPNRMRLIQAACCSSLFNERCNTNLCQSSLCSSHHNQPIENQPKICYSPSLDRPIYAKCGLGKSPKLQQQMSGNSYSCCSPSSTPTCCPRTDPHSDLKTVCSLRREPSLSCLKYAESSKGTTTDSSGYLSSSTERYHAPRLLKMCPALASPPQPPPPPPPAPKLMTTSSKQNHQQHYSNPGVSQRRDTRQRLTTFQSTGCPPTSQLNNNGTSKSIINRCLPNSSDVSPTCSSSYSSPSTSITSTQSEDSSLSMDHLRSVSPFNNQQKQQQQQQQRHHHLHSISVGNGASNHSNKNNNKQAGNQKASHKSGIPCPPPMPAPDVEFERKLSGILRQQDSLETKNNCGDESGNNIKNKRNHSNNNLLQAGGRKQEVNKNRLCFVDELKLIAKRHQQQSASQVSCSSSLSSIPVSLCSGGETSTIASSSSSSSSSASSTSDQSAIDSSTLIKIINASKSSNNANRNKGSYGCQITSRDRQHLEQNNNKCSHICSASSSNEQDNDHQLRCNIKSSHYCKHKSSPKSVVKLDDEHNKRRQHEMLMKEFKSAHSRMFKRRNANLEDESNQQVHSTTLDSNKFLENNKQQQRTPMRTVGASKTNVGLLSQQPVHLAAAN